MRTTTHVLRCALGDASASKDTSFSCALTTTSCPRISRPVTPRERAQAAATGYDEFRWHATIGGTRLNFLLTRTISPGALEELRSAVAFFEGIFGSQEVP